MAVGGGNDDDENGNNDYDDDDDNRISVAIPFGSKFLYLFPLHIYFIFKQVADIDFTTTHD